MRIRTRFCLVLALFSLVLTLAAVFLTRALLVQTALQTDSERAHDDLRQGVRAIQSKADNLRALRRDWAVWDDTYEFIASRDPRYIESNLVPSTLEDLRLNGLVILNVNREVAAALFLDEEDEPHDVLPTWLNHELTRPGGLLDLLDQQTEASGFLVAGESLWMIAAGPVLTSKAEGPSRGTLFMLRHFDEEEVARIGELVHPSLRLGVAARAWPTGQTEIRAINPTLLQARAVVPDIYTTSKILLSMQLPRDTYTQVSLSLWYLTGWIVVCGGAITLLGFYTLNRWVLRSVTDSVEALKTGMAGISADAPDRPPLQKRHPDEIGELVEAVDMTLRAFERSAREADRRRAEAMQAQKLASLGILVAGMAHEINNPNGVIAININVIRRLLDRLYNTLRPYEMHLTDPAHGDALDRFKTELDETSAELLAASERIAGLVDSLKAFSHPAPSELKECIDLNELVHKAAEWVRHEIDRHQCQLALDLAAHLPPVTGNRQQLLQVLINLIQNAYHAAMRPNTSIRVSALHDPASHRVTLAVTDDGRGIPAEHIHHVLDPFFTLRRTEGGTGLGLSISASIVRAHGGDIRIASTVGQGTTVTITLPTSPEVQDVT